MRTAAKTDANQAEIVAALRQCGATVQTLHTVRHGCPDLLVGYKGQNLLIEVKDGAKPTSERRLTPDQERWHAGWRGCVYVVDDVTGAIALVGARAQGFARRAST
jgi:hypothetical protein